MPIDNETLETALLDPAKAQQDGRIAEQHNIKHMLEVQRALQTDAAVPSSVAVDGRKHSTGGVRTSTFYPMD